MCQCLNTAIYLTFLLYNECNTMNAFQRRLKRSEKVQHYPHVQATSCLPLLCDGRLFTLPSSVAVRNSKNTFDFRHAWITHPTNHFISSITRLLVCVISLEKRPRLATMSQAGLWGTALYIDFELSNTSPPLHSHTLWSTTTTRAQTASHFRFIQTLIYTFWLFSPPNTVQPSYSNWVLVNPSWPARPAPAGCPL